MPDVSIAITAQDRYSSAIRTMSQYTRALDKDAEALERQLSELSNKKYELKVEADEAKKQLQALEKQYRATGDEADGLKAQMAAANYDNIKRNLDLVTRASKETERQMQRTGEAFGRAKGEAAGFGGTVGGVVQALAANYIGQQAMQLVQQGLGSAAASALGSAGGSMVSSILSGIVSGAAAGSMVNLGLGTVIGAGIGAVSGAASGAAAVFSSRDEAFQSYYNALYDGAAEARTGELTGGTDLASARETDLISFATLLGGRGVAEGYLAKLVTMANTTPFLYDDLTAMSKTLATYGYDGESLLPVLQTIGDAGAALGMGTGDMTMVATALGRMKSSNKTTLEYLNILNDRGIGAVGMLADYYGVDQGEIYAQISKGSIAGGEAAQILLDGLSGRYAGSMEEQSRTYAGLSSTLEGWSNEMENAMGSAYNETAKAGMQADIDAYGGALGEALKDMNAVIGEGQGMAENLGRQYTREALEAVLLGEDTSVYDAQTAQKLQGMHDTYVELMERYQAVSEGDKAGIAAEISALKGETEALAANAYDASDTAQSLREAQLSLIDAIKENTAALGSAAYLGEYTASQKKSQGLVSTAAWWEQVNADWGWLITLGEGYQNSLSHAYGLDRVPYDGYRAVLHQGERVLTARDARSMERPGGGVTVYVGGNYTVRTEADVADVARQLAEQILFKVRGGRL